MKPAKHRDLDPGWAFANIDLLVDFEQQDFLITALPGYTNRNFRLQSKDHDWVLRLPRSQTNRLIDRVAEAHNQTLAYQLGLAPGVAWRNSIGVSLTPTLVSVRGLKASDFNSDELLQIIIAPLQQLHRSGLCFQGREDLAALLAEHYGLLDKPLRQQFGGRMEQAQKTLARLQLEEQAMVPSHRDLVLENQMLGKDRLWYIDWEYSAMASPYWDLATLCNEAGLNPGQCRRLLQMYCVGGKAMKESTLFEYQGILKLFSECWMAALAEQPTGVETC